MSNSVGPNSPQPAATSVTAGSAAVRSIEPVPPPLTKRSGAIERTASTISRAPARELARGQRLHERQREPQQRLARRAVADARDLGLVGHQPVELEPGPRDDLACKICHMGGIVQRRALRRRAS